MIGPRKDDLTTSDTMAAGKGARGEPAPVPVPPAVGEAQFVGSLVAPLLLKPAEAGRLLGISRSKVFELLANGELPSIRIGRVRRIPKQFLAEWLRTRLIWRQPPDCRHPT